MKAWKILLFCLAFCLLLLPGCDKNEDRPDADVYIAGSYSRSGVTIPCVWKNGVRTDLEATEGRASSVFVSGDDVWVAGYQGSFGHGVTAPGYWKNGAWMELAGNGDIAWGAATSILVSAGDVYVTGYLREYSSVSHIPCIWKNGVRSNLELKADYSPDSGSGASLFIFGGNVFVAGAVWRSGCFQACPTACYWLNAARTDMDDGYSHGRDIAVSDGNVYMAGDYASLPSYWLNGVRTDLSLPTGHPSGDARAIRVVSGAIFVAGEVTDDQRVTTPCVWRNGDREELAVVDASLGGLASSLCVSSGDLFVAGYCHTATATAPCFWKNGVRTDLNLPDAASGGYADSIFVSGE